MSKHKNTIVFAYGSNMNRRQMALRCPSARAICTAVLADHRLEFAGFNGRWGGGVATVVPAKRQKVHGVLWLLSKDDMQRLDTFEGYPYVYDRAPVAVVTERGDQTWCHAYVKARVDRPTEPSEDYLRTILDGYRDAGLRPPARLRKLHADLSYQMAFPGVGL